MFFHQVIYFFKKLVSQDKFGYSMRALLALSSVWILCAYLKRWDLMTPLFLGVIASALAESEDYWRGRILALIVTLLSFAITSFNITLLFGSSILFVILLGLSTFCLIMLGAIGARYATIAQATLVLAVYNMLGMDSHPEGVEVWKQPLLLLSSALWHGLITIIWAAIFRHQSVQHNLAHVYLELSSYLKLKSALFEPLHNLNVRKISIRLANQNTNLIKALNDTRDALIQRMGKEATTKKIKRYRKLYFIAQDIHERVSASHYPYTALAEEFFHSDVLYRAKRLLKLHAKACKKLSLAIRMQTAYIHSDAGKNAVTDLQDAINFLQQLDKTPKRALRRALQALNSNLSTLEAKFVEAADAETQVNQDTNMRKLGPNNLREVIALISKQCTMGSLLFRHAIRKSLAMIAGYAVLSVTGLEKGYWILLTIAFVCQPGYATTLTLLWQRIGGTILGLIGSWALFRIFPDTNIQSILAIVAGVIFFIKRDNDRITAAACMTLLSFFCFNQIGDSYQLFLPRLVDTVIGCVIAALAVILILPDWRGRKLNTWLIDVLRCNGEYLAQIFTQYKTGEKNDLAYRIVRRDAHNAEVALSSKISDILREPKSHQSDTEYALRFLTTANTLLSYISAIGIQRDLQIDFNKIDAIANHLGKQINELIASLNDKKPINNWLEFDFNLENIELTEDEASIITNLELINKQLTDIKEIINDWYLAYKPKN